jgi:NADPH:quinone reductase
MLAMAMSGPGGPEVLRPLRLPRPEPSQPRQVLVRLAAAGVNPADLWFRAHGPYVGDGRGCILGHEGAGVVEAVGAAVTRVKPGDPVCFCHGGIGADPGTYAEQVLVPEELLVPVPPGVDLLQAAALPLVFITLWESLHERARLAPGEQVLIHAGAGGTGHIGVQVARRLGGRVAATVSTQEKAALVSGLGAERPILYKDEDFVAAAREWTGGRGLDVALDNVGAEVLQRTFKAMAVYGRVVTLMGTPGDTEAEDAYNGNLTIANVMMLTPMWRRMESRLAAQADMLRTGIAWLAEGSLRVHLDRVIPLEQAAEAHRRLQGGGTQGKIVLRIGG